MQTWKHAGQPICRKKEKVFGAKNPSILGINWDQAIIIHHGNRHRKSVRQLRHFFIDDGLVKYIALETILYSEELNETQIAKIGATGRN